MMDSSCLIAATLFFISNMLNIAVRLTRFEEHHSDLDQWQDLDVDYLKKEWDYRSGRKGLRAAQGFFNAIAWFVLCVPLLQVVWILSAGGKRKMGLHCFIAALVVAGSISELASRLMMVGMDSVAQWIAADFNLDNWFNRQSNDGMGWRTLEIAYLLGRGILLWVDAFEYLAIFGSLALLFRSIRGQLEYASLESWSALGLMVGVLSLWDFVFEILTAEVASWFYNFAIVITILNTLVLLPIWLVLLSYRLPIVKANFEGTEGEFMNQMGGGGGVGGVGGGAEINTDLGSEVEMSPGGGGGGGNSSSGGGGDAGKVDEPTTPVIS